MRDLDDIIVLLDVFAIPESKPSLTLRNKI